MTDRTWSRRDVIGRRAVAGAVDLLSDLSFPGTGGTIRVAGEELTGAPAHDVRAAGRRRSDHR